MTPFIIKQRSKSSPVSNIAKKRIVYGLNPSGFENILIHKQVYACFLREM